MSALIILIILGVPKVKNIDPKRTKKRKRALIRNTIIMILPSILVAYLMLEEAAEDEKTLTGFETAIDIQELTDEMTVLFPEITGISIGQLEELDEDGNPVQKKVIILETDADPESEEYQQDAAQIKNWLAARYEDYVVEMR